MSEFLESLGSVTYIISLAFGILMAISINLECRARNVGARTAYTILAIFFPIFVGIIYAVKRKGAQKAFKVCGKCGKKVNAYAGKCPYCSSIALYEYKNPHAKTLKIISIVLCVIAVGSYAISSAITLPDTIKAYQKEMESYMNGETDAEDEYFDDEIIEGGLGYDRNGLAYSDASSVVFYDKEGNKFTHSGDTFINKDTGESLDADKCFVDKEGYFYYFKDKKLTSKDRTAFQDEDGNIYYHADRASWNYSSQLMINGEKVN